MNTCPQCSQTFVITIEDRSFYRKIDVPEPMWCPRCRHLRRHGHINDYVFYRRPCDGCKKDFVSIFSAESEYVVYCQPCWYSEKRDHFAQGREYDFKRGFFEQFDELMHTAPQLGIIGTNNENCDYCESAANCRNCYLISESSNCEDSLYCYWIQKSKSCIDCSYLHECDRCYEANHCFNGYNLHYSQNCFNCSDSYFLDQCVDCRHCLFSTNLRHKEFYIFNKSYSKEAYFQELEKLQLGNYDLIQMLQKKFQEFLKTQPRKHLQIENVENCSGDYIRNAKNCRQVFHCYDAEECAYGEHVWRGAKYCYDSNTAGRNAELLYETTNSGIESYNVKFSRYCWGSHDVEYSNSCKQCESLFGCVSLKGDRYCILNKPYSKNDYEALVSKIKTKMRAEGEYGEFFPLSISLFGYNDTPSFDDYPLTKDEALRKGWKWQEHKVAFKNQGTIDMASLPKGIDKTGRSIVDEILTCQTCSKNYRITLQEFKFYQEAIIPLPRQCPFCRHKNRLALHNKKKISLILCAHCKKEVPTTLDPVQFKMILCEACYLKEVY